MELSRLSPAPARYTGIGLVIAVHLIAITALSVAFVKPVPRVPGPIEFRPVPKTPEPPPQPVEHIKARQPIVAPVPVAALPLPDDPTITPDPVIYDPAARATPATAGPVATGGATVAGPALAPAQPQVQRPGAVCATMPRPDLPALNWSGEAVLHALATVRGGRVVASEIRVAQGALDSRTRRALQHSVEAALAGYQCAGNAMFEQDFAFRLD